MDLLDLAAEHGLGDPAPLGVTVGVAGHEIEGLAVDNKLHATMIAQVFDETGSKV